ncbi:sensor histidine kinase [Geobacillus sp. Y412MC52]|uniref:sensor histidine kinase n=1 Tax=Geobacillus sp. (strain Y412MC52) TaxID=550542 RepID=UPI00018C11A5|nr:HAMP domain-containing sensor histidine kinase [Geobacillus sp. Y412MC52]ADU93300.1 integral membrane sensor signal transduction histidine kinase [Geobacillus sp. Y412MC52]
MKRLRFVLKSVLTVIAVMTIISLFWTAAYFITEAIYTRFAWRPQPLVRQIITSIFGFFLFGISMSAISPFLRKREKMLWQHLMDALNRIAKGDFRVNLRVDWGERNHWFGELVTRINDMAANLQAMEEMRQEFISNVSHEIGSPLTSIRGFARALKNENLSREQRMHYLDIIETECVRMSKLSENLLRLAMLDSDRHPFHPTSYRLDTQLQTLILHCEPQWAEKELDMCVMLEKVVITAYEDLLSQVWLNLIHNAIKFTPKGGTITIQLQRRGEQAIITFSDTGPGISEHDQPRIFERFYKADKSRHRAAGGSGLGLSIAKKIVDIHHGTISVQSQPGEGATFIVELPIQGPSS